MSFAQPVLEAIDRMSCFEEVCEMSGAIQVSHGRAGKGE